MHNKKLRLYIVYDFYYFFLFQSNIYAILREYRLTSCVPRMVVEFDLSRQCDSGWNRELQTRS